MTNLIRQARRNFRRLLNEAFAVLWIDGLRGFKLFSPHGIRHDGRITSSLSLGRVRFACFPVGRGLLWHEPIMVQNRRLKNCLGRPRYI
jgi:hypothetical protein